jgi:predicted nucleic acid-binding protein
VIAYLDTSVVVPLLVDEPSSTWCEQLWDRADEVATVRIAYVEAAAAVAQARRLGRLSRREQLDAAALLDDKWSQLDVIEIDQNLMARAATLADVHGLRGYDATHCAGAESVNDDELVAASGDQMLLAAWRALELSTFDANAGAESD